MIIKNVTLSRENGQAVLSAVCKLRKIGWDTVYFSVGEDRGNYILRDASPFAAVLLIPSMLQGEDLTIHGSISRQLYDGMQHIMNVVLGWNIGLKPIAIRADTITPDTQHPTKTASFFSGGVDSFYTFLKHQNDTDTAARVDSLILIKSFDVDARNTELWEMTLKDVTAVTEATDTEIVAVSTNIHGLLRPMLVFNKADYCDFWDFVHGGCLAAVGLLLRQEFSLIYVPSTHSEGEQIPWGSCLALDGHWSTEATQFVHDGAEATRVNKVLWQIAKSPLALRYLRVCYENVKGQYNCGRCDKCLRTMINLYVAGVLEQSSTFPHEIDPQLVAASPTIKGEFGSIFHQENLAALRERNLNPELQAAILSSMKNTVELRPSLAFKVQEWVIYFDHAYFGGILYRTLALFFGRRFS